MSSKDRKSNFTDEYFESWGYFYELMAHQVSDVIYIRLKRVTASF